MTPLQLAELAHQLADRACIVDIELHACVYDEQRRKWYDTRPMLDPNEQPDDFIDMNRQALAYAHERGLISPHPVHTHLVRIVKAVA
jgi:hypothetical protein